MTKEQKDWLDNYVFPENRVLAYAIRQFMAEFNELSEKEAIWVISDWWERRAWEKGKHDD